MIKMLLHTRFGTFVVALLAGLSLALAIGAFASGGSDSSGSKARARPSNENAALATKLPDTAVMRVFAKPSTLADQLPGPAAAVVESFNDAPGVDQSLLPGEPLLDQARLVISNVGPTGRNALYAVPTAKHLLCAVWYPDAPGGGCFQGFAPGSPALFGQSSEEGVVYIWGFLRDDVKSVSIVEDGVSRPAVLGQSAFYFQASDPSSRLTAVVAQLANGGSRSIALSALPGSGLK